MHCKRDGKRSACAGGRYARFGAEKNDRLIAKTPGAIRRQQDAPCLPKTMRARLAKAKGLSYMIIFQSIHSPAGKGR